MVQPAFTSDYSSINISSNKVWTKRGMSFSKMEAFGMTNQSFVNDTEETQKVKEDIFAQHFTPSIQRTTRNVPARSNFRLSYEFLLWSIFIVTTTLCVIDGFAMSGDAVCGRASKNPGKLWKNKVRLLTSIIFSACEIYRNIHLA